MNKINKQKIKCLFFAAEKVCSDWTDIVLTIRDRVFEEDEEQLIDIHDVKVHTCSGLFLML